VNGAVDEFLEARRRIDLQAIEDTAGILTAAAERERGRVEQQLAAVAQARRQAPRPTAPRPARASAEAAIGAAGSADDGLDGLRVGIGDAQAARADLEKRHADQVAQARARLAERRTVLTERHPEIQAMRRALDGLAAEPNALAAARRLEAELLAEYAGKGGDPARLDVVPAGAGGRAVDAAADAAAAVLSRAAGMDLPAATLDDEDDTLAYQRSLLKSLIENYQDLLGRLANVQVELQTAQAAFPYRYSVTLPTRLPKKADSPNVLVLLVGALLSGALAGAASAVFAELRAQALMSPAAVRRFLAAEAA
jgi:hypothetical protein